MFGQTTTSTVGARDATPPVQGATRDFILAGLVAYGISKGVPPEVTTELAGFAGPIIFGLGVGVVTGIRKKIVASGLFN